MYPLTTQLPLDRHKVCWQWCSALIALALRCSFTLQVQIAAFASHPLERQQMTNSYLPEPLRRPRSLATSGHNYLPPRRALFLLRSDPAEAFCHVAQLLQKAASPVGSRRGVTIAGAARGALSPPLRDSGAQLCARKVDVSEKHRFRCSSLLHAGLLAASKQLFINSVCQGLKSHQTSSPCTKGLEQDSASTIAALICCQFLRNSVAVVRGQSGWKLPMVGKRPWEGW